MLNTLKLTNFRRHADLTVDFSDGINVLRAANEGGKSTLLEAVTYALFGSKALRTTFEQTVTWGEDPKTLKVELSLTADGRTYLFKRSKAGAEVILDAKVFCTGQNEVSSLAATLLGADAATAQSLLMASQGAIRGALEQGPKALSTLIEDLAGFSTFDEILEAAQEKLALGSPGLLEERLKGAEATRVAATESLPPKADEGAHAVAVRELTDRVDTIKASVPTLAAAEIEADKAWKEASALYLQKNVLDVNAMQALKTLDAARQQVDTLAPAAGKTFDMAAIEVLQKRVTFAENYNNLVVAHRLFRGLPDGPTYPGPIHEYQSARDQFAAGLKEATAEVTMLDKHTQAAQARRINHDKCDKCGQDITHLDTVTKINAEVDADLMMLSQKRGRAFADMAKNEEALAGLKLIRANADAVQQVINKISGYVNLDESVYPPLVVWVSEVPTDKAPDLDSLRRQLSAAVASAKEIEAAKAKLDLAVEQKERAELMHAAAVKAYAEFEAPDADTMLAITATKDEAVLAHGAARGDVLLIGDEIARLVAAHQAAAQLWAAAQGRVDDAVRVIAECRKDLDSLGFNNALVKKLRAIRPLIANKLWGTVLASVSVMFSQMRGEESWVSKEKGGFCANGHAVESLSGSTLDVLGLAIRCSLMRTFLPQCGLLVLDEPCAEMDAERTEALLGFLKSVDFQQTLLVSHEEISESVADNLIQL